MFLGLDLYSKDADPAQHITTGDTGSIAVDDLDALDYLDHGMYLSEVRTLRAFVLAQRGKVSELNDVCSFGHRKKPGLKGEAIEKWLICN